MTMDFGIALPSMLDSWKTVQRAEELGLSHAWFYDTQMLSPDIFVTMALAADKTSRIKLGMGVMVPTNRIAVASTRFALFRPMFGSMLAEACASVGQIEEAISAVDEVLPIAQTEDRYYEAELNRLRGEFLLMRGNTERGAAEDCFRTAIDIARRQSAKSWELRATTSLARLLAKQGKRDEARTMLADTYGWFTEGFDTADLKDAKALLDELGA